MKNMTIAELKEDLSKKGFKLTPYSEGEINQAINFFGDLPETLIEYYQLIGKIDLNGNHGAHIYIISPGDLVKTHAIGFDFMKFADEYCGMFDLSLKKEDIKLDNPEIYMSGEVVYGILEIHEDKEEKWRDEKLLFEDEEDGILYLSGQVPELSEELKTDDNENTNPLQDLLTAINYFFRYDEAFLNKQD